MATMATDYYVITGEKHVPQNCHRVDIIAHIKSDDEQWLGHGQIDDKLGYIGGVKWGKTV